MGCAPPAASPARWWRPARRGWSGRLLLRPSGSAPLPGVGASGVGAAVALRFVGQPPAGAGRSGVPIIASMGMATPPGSSSCGCGARGAWLDNTACFAAVGRAEWGRGAATQCTGPGATVSGRVVASSAIIRMVVAFGGEGRGEPHQNTERHTKGIFSENLCESAERTEEEQSRRERLKKKGGKGCAAAC